MAPTMHVPLGEERRSSPRHERRHPIAIQPVGGAMVDAETLDVSIGGMRVRVSSPVPLGACDIFLSGRADDRLVIQGTVVEEVLDASTGEVTARIVFYDGARGVAEQVTARIGRDGRFSRRRWLAVLGASGIIVVAITAALVLANDGEPTAGPVSTAVPAPLSEADRGPSTSSAPPETALTVVTTAPPTAPPSTAAPTPSADVPASPPTTGAPPSPTATSPATATHSESADNYVSVVLGTTSEDTAVSSFMGPSEGVDRVRMQVHLTPEPDGTALPVAVTVENRGEETLRFPDGLTAFVSATRDGAVAGSTTLTAANITELAPGELVSVEGMLDFGATGEYAVAAQVDVVG